MKDAIQLDDLAVDTANKLREMFNTIGERQGEDSFANLKEEEIIAACVFFMDMMLKNPLILTSPVLLASMRASLNLATGQGDEISTALRRLMTHKGNGDGAEE